MKGDPLLKHIPVIVLSGLGQANKAKLLKEGTVAFLMKSDKSFENNSLALCYRRRQYVLPSKRYADLILESDAALPAVEKNVYDAIVNSHVLAATQRPETIPAGLR